MTAVTCLDPQFSFAYNANSEDSTSHPGFRKTLGRFHDRYMRHFGPSIYGDFLIWPLRERALVRDSCARLDADIIFTAYSFTTDLRYLTGAAATNLATSVYGYDSLLQTLMARIHMDFGYAQRGGGVSMEADMHRFASMSYRFFLAGMHRAMYLPEALIGPIKLHVAANDSSPSKSTYSTHTDRTACSI